MRVPHKYTIPHNETNWPRENFGLFYGFRLGWFVSSVRQGKHPELVEELKAAGFDMKPWQRRREPSIVMK